MNYFITGGTGSIGKELTKQLLPILGDGKLVIYSRDELKQAEMAEQFPEGGRTGIRYLIGNICDYDRLVTAMKGSDIVIHAAAMKRIDTCEYNTVESLNVNVLGSMNVARACIETGVKSCLFTSTDKACNPISAYGSQKQTVERLWIGMNNFTPTTKFNCVRYGNVWGSRGSFLQKWKKAVGEEKSILLTDAEMTRFFWKIEEAAKFIDHRLVDIDTYKDRGCIYIPKMSSKKMFDIAKEFNDNIKITGMRCPEKLHEELISEIESMSTYDNGSHFIIYPTMHNWCADIKVRGTKVEKGFNFKSNSSDSLAYQVL